ncbi:MAG: chemotaxis protein CheV [Lachnospiraceae bacterium]|nr:chemotaxis protein CheV [Lachnospiraceae bacterium]
METNILLESGTNELELLEFIVNGYHYGINVAKISELIPYKTPTPVPNSHECIEGIFMPRDFIISVINLAKCLGYPTSKNPQSDMYIVTNFNKLHTAFHVDKVLGIHRIFWSDISKPDSTISAAGNASATGIVRIDDELIIILDFEKIVSEINPETGVKMSDIEKLGVRKRNDMPILIAEDSPLLSKMIRSCLEKAGYSNVIPTDNGQEAWDMLNKYYEEGDLDKKVSCLITDIEMPKMDGHRLTKLVKESKEFKHIPVVIFSSLVSPEMKRKGEALGADAQLSKPEIGLLVGEIDKLILK